MFRIECPECHTSYTSERCGMREPVVERPTRASVVCLCGKTLKVNAEAMRTPGTWRTLWQDGPPQTVVSVEAA